jgi:hypothetical protein
MRGPCPCVSGAAVGYTALHKGDFSARTSVDQDDKLENGIRQQAKDLFGSASGRAQAGYRRAHGFLEGRSRRQQVLIIGASSLAGLLLLCRSG